LSRPRRDRWLSLLEVATLLDEHAPRLAQLSRKRRREHVLRLVRRVERRDGERLSKRVGREWFVSRNAVDALQRWEPEALSELERSVAHLHAKTKQHDRQLNAHGSKLRELAEKQRLADAYLTGLARLDAAPLPQERRTG
jgi:uncharacterized membrane-anchored protein YjiN (DUF445 family)